MSQSSQVRRSGKRGKFCIYPELSKLEARRPGHQASCRSPAIFKQLADRASQRTTIVSEMHNDRRSLDEATFTHLVRKLVKKMNHVHSSASYIAARPFRLPLLAT